VAEVSVSAVEAVIFDLDGLILDSETPEYLAWQAVYARYGLEFPLAGWLHNVGRNDGPFDPLGPFRRGDSPASPPAAAALWEERRDELLRDFLTPLPGVVALLDGVQRAGWRTAVASSSRVARVRLLLTELGLTARFDVLVGGDEVEHAKPAPDVYLLAAERLRVRPEACVALEDSENGIRAAASAGMRCIAVPSPMTRGMDFSRADLVVGSLVDVAPRIIAALEGRSRSPRR
jgi:HAD superfamily hydrolase (TIGR01509 family)